MSLRKTDTRGGRSAGHSWGIPSSTRSMARPHPTRVVTGLTVAVENEYGNYLAGKVMDGGRLANFRHPALSAGIVLNGNIAVADTSAAAREVIRPLVADSIAHRSVNRHSLRQLGVTVEQAEAWRADPASITDGVLRDSAIAGNPEECVEGLARFASSGITQLAMRFPEQETVRAVGTAVLPKLRR